MKRIVAFNLCQFFLFWLISLMLFLTSGRGERWASWELGVKYDANEFGVAVLAILAVLALSGLSLLLLYRYFLQRWEEWREDGVVSSHKSTLVATIPLPFIFFYLNGFDPFFPIFKFISHLVTTWYGLPRLSTYLAIPLFVAFLLGLFSSKATGNYIRTVISICASYITIPVIIYTDRIVGGNRSGWTGYLNLPDRDIHIYVTASASLAYICCIIILTLCRSRHRAQDE